MPESSRPPPLIGCWLNTPSSWACEIIAMVGFDAVFLDGEHGISGAEALDSLTALARALGISVYCRVATAARPQIQQALDSGADAIVLPQITNANEARAAAALAKYPPLGSRGMGAPRSLGYGNAPPDFVENENLRTRCFVMIETPGALRDVESIAALPTVDGLFMGPYDLSLTRGRGQYAQQKADWTDADRIASAAASAGKLLGMPAFSKDDVVRAIGYRAGVITIGDEISTLAEALRSNIGRIRTLLASGTG